MKTIKHVAASLPIPARVTTRLLKRIAVLVSCILIGWLLVYIIKRLTEREMETTYEGPGDKDLNEVQANLKNVHHFNNEIESKRSELIVQAQSSNQPHHMPDSDAQSVKSQSQMDSRGTGFDDLNGMIPFSSTEAGSDSTTVQISSKILCQNLHIFYYPWYGNPKFDGRYIHWNHKPIPHWDPNVANAYKHLKEHVPPNDIGSDFYPELGPYSSRDPNVITEHIKQIASAGIKVIIVSYYPPKTADDNGDAWDDIYPILFDKALQYDLKVTFHIEPYKNRDESTLRNDIKHVVDTYGNHKALYRYRIKSHMSVPLIYVYDSYHTKPEEWARLLKPDGDITIRGTKYDVMAIALVVEPQHKEYVTIGGFNGLYTYFATNGFTYGSTWLHWKQLAEFARSTNALFIPSVGPGYIDVSIRPWNSQNTRSRLKGDYYKEAWGSALAVEPSIVSITSFNEWHEGTQIEKAIPKKYNLREYKDYTPFGPDYYLNLTQKFAMRFAKCNAN